MLVEPTTTTKLVEPSAVVVPMAKGRPSAEADSPSRKKGEDVQLLQGVLEAAQNYLEVSDVGVAFSVHGETGVVKVSVTDKETGEVIREIPPEGVLTLMAKLDEMLGILFDEKA